MTVGAGRLIFHQSREPVFSTSPAPRQPTARHRPEPNETVKEPRHRAGFCFYAIRLPDHLYTSSDCRTMFLSSAADGAMGKLYQIGNIIIRIYPNDHLPFHFHVISPDFEALIEIETLTVREGSLPAAARKKVWTWIEANRAAIVAEWNRTNPRFPIA